MSGVQGIGIRHVVLILGLFASAGCGSDIASADSARISRDNALSRTEAQGPRVYNPDVTMCVDQSATEGERQVLTEGGAAAEATMSAILNRKETRLCMRDNNVVIYL